MKTFGMRQRQRRRRARVIFSAPLILRDSWGVNGEAAVRWPLALLVGSDVRRGAVSARPAGDQVMTLFRLNFAKKLRTRISITSFAGFFGALGNHPDFSVSDGGGPQAAGPLSRKRGAHRPFASQLSPKNAKLNARGVGGRHALIGLGDSRGWSRKLWNSY